MQKQMIPGDLKSTRWKLKKKTIHRRGVGVGAKQKIRNPVSHRITRAAGQFVRRRAALPIGLADGKALPLVQALPQEKKKKGGGEES